MKRFRHFSSNQNVSSDINMSPLIDIIFILLIFFVVTTVFIDDPGVEINKPTARSAEEVQKNSILIAVTNEDEIYCSGRNVGQNAIGNLIASLLASEPDLPVVIQGDKQASHGVIMKVTDAAQSAGAKKVYSATAK